MPPFFHDRRKGKARLPTGVGISRRHPSITFPEVFRFRGAGDSSVQLQLPPQDAETLEDLRSYVYEMMENATELGAETEPNEIKAKFLDDLLNKSHLDLGRIECEIINSPVTSHEIYGESESESESEDIIKTLKSSIRQNAPEETDQDQDQSAVFTNDDQDHEMKILDPNKSWQMFEKCPNQLKEVIERAMFRKCNGLPLAIQVVGSQLCTSTTTRTEIEHEALEDIIKTFKSFIRKKAPDEHEHEHAVGVEEEVEKMLRESILNEEKRGLSIAAVVGMGGIGKSTLAREVYSHPNVVDRFDARAWVEVSSEFTPNETFIQLILQLSISNHDKLRQQIRKLEWGGRLIRLETLLFEHLVGKSYFIVLDGLWEKDQWEFLRSSLPNQGKGSRLLLTSRNRNIVGHEQVHEMKILDPNKSWQMFLKTVFTNDEKCPKQLEKIGREILKKCSGLPLAIQVVGSQLAKKSRCKSVWEDFLESMDLSGISAVLELSYVKLPPKLKSCFRSLGLFKQGTTIKVEKLVQVWIAGGMISKGEGEKNHSNEEIGRRYLDGLITQCMVQEKDMTMDCRLKSCCMNDNLHRLSITKAEEELRYEVQQEDGSYQTFHKPRSHRAIFCTREKFNYSTNHDECLRSLFFHGGGYFYASPSYWESLEQLKILYMEGFGLKCLPQNLGRVTNLRYLGLRSNFVQKIPRSLGHLEKLEVLDISHNFMVEVADIIWRMESLCHLYMSDIICQRPLRIDALKHLQTLTYISAENWCYELSGLQKMKSLRKLGIEDLDETSDVSKLFTSLAKLKNLDCLILRGFRFRSMPSLDQLGILTRLTKLKLNGLLTRLPCEKNFPPNIAYLTLVNSSLVENPMPMLGKLSKLVYLKLRNAFTGEEMVIACRKFAMLQVLSIGVLALEKFTSCRRCNAEVEAIRNQQLSISGDPPT